MEKPKQSLYSRNSFFNKVLFPLPEGPQKTSGLINWVVSCFVSSGVAGLWSDIVLRAVGELIVKDSMNWVLMMIAVGLLIGLVPLVFTELSFVKVEVDGGGGDGVAVTQTGSTLAATVEASLHFEVVVGSVFVELLIRLQAIWSNLSCCWSKSTVSTLSRFFIILTNVCD